MEPGEGVDGGETESEGGVDRGRCTKLTGVRDKWTEERGAWSQEVNGGKGGMESGGQKKGWDGARLTEGRGWSQAYRREGRTEPGGGEDGRLFSTRDGSQLQIPSEVSWG